MTQDPKVEAVYLVLRIRTGEWPSVSPGGKLLIVKKTHSA